MNYNIDYFIEKFEAIKEERWFVGNFHNREHTQFCALGLCGMYDVVNKVTEQNALVDLFWASNLQIVKVNDGKDDRYPQPHPKERVLAALYDLKAAEALKEAEKIISEPIKTEQYDPVYY